MTIENFSQEEQFLKKLFFDTFAKVICKRANTLIMKCRHQKNENPFSDYDEYEIKLRAFIVFGKKFWFGMCPKGCKFYAEKEKKQ